jgi:hypothetical protein
MHDDWTDLLERLRHMRGRFHTEPGGMIRHRTLECPQTAFMRERYGTVWACPLVALTLEVSPGLREIGNDDFRRIAYVLDLPLEQVEAFAMAADGEGDLGLRRRIVETLEVLGA